MKDAVEVRPTTKTDLEIIANIAEQTELFPREMLGSMISGYLDGSRSDIWLTAVCQDRPVGFAFCEPERMTSGTWNLLAIGVHPLGKAKVWAPPLSKRSKTSSGCRGIACCSLRRLDPPTSHEPRASI